MVQSRPFAGFCVVMLACLAAATAADAAKKYKILYSFCSQQNCADGSGPYAGLIADKAGNFYGATYGGGTAGAGAVFKLASGGGETVLYSFCTQQSCSNGQGDGQFPYGTLVRDKAGNLYGTTVYGGSFGDGSAFIVAPNGTETLLHSFLGAGNGDGATPVAGLIRDGAGNLYGTTYYGGTNNDGTVFSLAPNGTVTLLYSFTGASGDEFPKAGVIRDSAGNLYGASLGAAFKLAPNGTETVLHYFGGTGDGTYPLASLLRDKSGNLYGTTDVGGAYGLGTVFEIAADGTESVLYSFAGGNDGAYTNANDALVRDKAGNLYGTTVNGGGAGCGGTGCGTVFRLAPDGTETVLHRFAGGSDGGYPVAGLLLNSAKGELYGTTFEGGGTGCGGNGCGTVFRIKQ